MSSPLILFLLLAVFFLEETPDYLLSKGREADAIKVVNKIAKLNKKSLPEDFKLLRTQTPCEDKDRPFEQSTNEKSYIQLFFLTMRTGNILKVFVLIILIGAAGKMINDALNFVLADILFIQGQSNDYCSGAHSKSYYISKSDYLKLFISQLTSVITVFVSIPVMKFATSLKVQSLFCFSLCVVLIIWLYFCPNVYVVLAILSVVRIAMQLINISAVLALLQLEVPARVRGLIVGLGQSLRNTFLPLYAFFTQALSKESQHFVTSLTLSIMVVGFVSAVLIPKNINEGIENRKITNSNSNSEE